MGTGAPADPDAVSPPDLGKEGGGGGGSFPESRLAIRGEGGRLVDTNDSSFSERRG
jgi:hypothetical protein